jgi:hypothetical protein
MATINPVKASPTGVAVPMVAAAAGGDTLNVGFSDPVVDFIVRNGGASAVTVTLHGVKPCSGGVVHDTVVPVNANTDEHIIVPGVCIDEATGHVAVTYSAVTSVTVGAVQQS